MAEWWDNDPCVSLGLTSNQWYHLVFVYSYDGNRHIDWYKNGVPQTRGNGGTNSAYAWTTLTFGSLNGEVCYSGMLDEIRVSACARSTNWVWAEYMIMASNTVFNNYGAMTEPNAPAIRNQPVAAVTTNSATFNGLLASAGSSACTVCVLWGEEDGAVTGAWAHTNQWRVGAWGNDTRPSTNISLTPDRICYYTFGASNATTNVVAADPVSFLAGAVGVKTSRRESSEDQTASFVIYRPATATNGVLAVNFTLGGTGESGRDYDPIVSPAVIPPGASEVRLPVVPSFSFGDTRPKMVTLSIAPGGYVIGVQNNATILTRPPKEHGE